MINLVVPNFADPRTDILITDRRGSGQMDSSGDGTDCSRFNRCGTVFYGLTSILSMIRVEKLNKGVTRWV